LRCFEKIIKAVILPLFEEDEKNIIIISIISTISNILCPCKSGRIESTGGSGIAEFK